MRERSSGQCRDGAGGLWPRQSHHLRRILEQALATAVRWRILPYNPLDAIDAPKVERTQLLSSGVPPKIAQERLGHSSAGITLDLYSHVPPGMQEDAAAKVDAAIRAAIEGS
jgi:integrase